MSGKRWLRQACQGIHLSAENASRSAADSAQARRTRVKKWPHPLLLILEAPFRLPGRQMHPARATTNSTRLIQPQRQSGRCRTMPYSLIRQQMEEPT